MRILIIPLVSSNSSYYQRPGWLNELGIGLPNNSYKPITNTAWVRAGFVNYQKGRTRLAAASDKAYQLLAHSRWFSSGTPASSTNKTGHHDIAEILLKVALSTKNQSINLTINVRCGLQTFRKENWWVASDEFNTRYTSYVCL